MPKGTILIIIKYNLNRISILLDDVFIYFNKYNFLENIKTLIGYYHKDNKFETIDGNIIPCITYRNYNKELKYNILYCVNMRYSLSLKEWVLFQAVSLEDVSLTNQGKD